MIEPAAESAIELLLLDVGNTIAFLDVGAVADIVSSHGHPLDARVLARVEGRAKRRYEELMARGVSHEDAWGLYLASLLEEGGLEPSAARAMVAPLRRAHDAFNLWRRVPEGLDAALDRARTRMRIAIVSNSEGRLPELLERIGIARHFESITDSHHEGVRKPDPEIFRRALERAGSAAERAIYLGDIPGVDVVGAHAAGMRAVLIDPFGFYPEYEGEKARSVTEWIDRYLSSAGAAGRAVR